MGLYIDERMLVCVSVCGIYEDGVELRMGYKDDTSATHTPIHSHIHPCIYMYIRTSSLARRDIKSTISAATSVKNFSSIASMARKKDWCACVRGGGGRRGYM